MEQLGFPKAPCSVHISTDFVFRGDKGSPYTEEDPAEPIDVYGTSKLAGEHLVRQGTSRWLIVLISSVFGSAGSGGKGGNFIETVLKKAQSGSPVQVVRDIWMSPTSTADAAEAIEALIRKGAEGIFHALNGGRCSWFEFAQAAFEMTGSRVALEPVRAASYITKARRPGDSSLSNECLEKNLGRAMRPWKDALKAYLIEKGHIKR
jgi:dTDP-4-dehydrorhamnose reductase